MPEHGWYKESLSGQQTWFYKMYGSDPALQGQVEWSIQHNALSFMMQTPSGFILNTTATLQDEGVVITHDVVSASVLHMAAVQAPTCVKLYRPFTDIFLERTYVHLPDGLALIAADTPDRLAQNAEEWLPCRYIAGVGKTTTRAPYRTELVDGVVRYFKADTVDTAFMATESAPGGWTAATYASHCTSVFTNPARTCQHTDAEARYITDGRATLALNVLVVRGTAQDAWDLVKA